MPEWIPVSQLLAGQAGAAPEPAQFASPSYSNPAPAYNPVGGAYPGPATPAALAASPYPDAPNLHWGLVLLFDILTCSLFMVVWNLIVAAWLKRVQPNATSLYFYLGALVLSILQIAVSIPNSIHLAMMGPGCPPRLEPGGQLHRGSHLDRAASSPASCSVRRWRNTSTGRSPSACN